MLYSDCNDNVNIVATTQDIEFNSTTQEGGYAAWVYIKVIDLERITILNIFWYYKIYNY